MPCPWIELFCDRDGPIGYVEHVRRGAFGGEIVAETLDTWRPSTPGPHPAVLWIHGGGWRYGDLYGGGLPAAAEAAAAAGVVVVSVNYRRSADAPWRAQAEDVACALGWLHAKAADLGVDPDRIALVGHSAGGHLAAWTGEVAPDPGPDCVWPAPPRPAGVVSLAGPTDLPTFYRTTLPWGQKMLRRLLGFRPRADDAVVLPRLPDADPAAHVTPMEGGAAPADARPWVVQVAGTRDVLVPVEQSRAYDAVLAAAGRDHTLTIVDEDHGGSQDVAYWLPVVLDRL